MVENSVGHDPEDIYGLLPDWVIKYYIKNNVINIDPLRPDWEDRIAPVTIDLRLGPRIKILKPSDVPIDSLVGVTENDYEQIDIDESEGYIFRPDDFVIAKTLERVTLPSDTIAMMGGKSSLARVGIGVFVTAARFDPGWDEHPMLELTNVGGRPFVLRAGMDICAFSFERLMASAEHTYNGRFRDGAYTEVRYD